MNSKTALVTGASAGIGLAFAKSLGAKGYNLVLSARREERLNKIAKELRSKYHIKVLVITADLSLKEAPELIFRRLAEEKVNIDFLVNNAGYSLAKSFSQNPWKDISNFLEVMMISVTRLSHLALPYMKKQKQGCIINVGSVAAFVPEDKGSLYTAVKSYVLSFSKALAKEVESSNINVLALCPGFTHTEFHDVLGNKEAVSKFPKLMWMDAKTVVEEGYQAVKKRKKVHINGFVNKVICFLFTIIPERVLDFITPKKIIENSYKTTKNDSKKAPT